MEGGDPARVIEQIVNSLRPRASAKRVMIASNLESARISFDSRQLGAALEAVLSRAVDAAPEGGEVVVALTRRDGELRIEIKDNGAALDDDKRLKFFDPLAGDRINRTALGLAMARRIIERHGGRISARANTAAGTIVEVNLSMG